MLDNFNKTIYFIVGPTAIGKSKFAIRLAKKFKAVIINADSMQVYSNLKILTARPLESELKEVAHYLYGYVEGSKRYNVATWCEDVLKIVKKNEKKNIPSIIVGGTAMYIYSLINGIIDIPSIPEIYKKKSLEILNDKGLRNFINLISDFDSFAVKNVSKNDTLRLRRIWEVYRYTGKTFSKWNQQKNKNFIENYKLKILLFNPPREKIYNNINNRFIKMIDEGAIAEVQKLKNLKLNNSLPIMRAHGVPEISEYLLNNITIDQCIKKGQQVTRNYAKRQLTWWRSSSLEIEHVFDQFPNEIDENLIKK